MDDGQSLDIGPDTVFDIPPGHDKWVVGDEPWVTIEWGASGRALGAALHEAGARSLATVLFTDIVDSTARLESVGDAAWHDLLAAHNSRLREQLNIFRGREVKTTGDGFIAVFDSPTRAAQCAAEMTRSVRSIGLEIRVGLHTGEIELVGDDVRGIAVHTARGCSLAGPGGCSCHPRRAASRGLGQSSKTRHPRDEGPHPACVRCTASSATSGSSSVRPPGRRRRTATARLALTDAPGRRMTISDAIQPVSNALYAKHGLFPTTPILAFRGRASLDVATDLVAASETGPSALAMLDRAAYGFDRSVDHAFWAGQAEPTLWLREGEPVAYSYRWPRGRIGPLAGRDEAAAAAALAAELGRQPRHLVEIPGTSAALVRVAVEAGLRLVAPPGLLLLSDGVEPPRSLAISSYRLY
jgi:hypothetical protein